MYSFLRTLALQQASAMAIHEFILCHRKGKEFVPKDGQVKPFGSGWKVFLMHIWQALTRGPARMPPL